MNLPEAEEDKLLVGGRRSEEIALSWVASLGFEDADARSSAAGRKQTKKLMSREYYTTCERFRGCSNHASDLGPRLASNVHGWVKRVVKRVVKNAEVEKNVVRIELPYLTAKRSQ